MHCCFPPYVPHAPPISFFFLLPWSYKSWSPSCLLSFLPSLTQTSSSTPCSRTPSACFPPSMSATNVHTHTKWYHPIYRQPTMFHIVHGAPLLTLHVSLCLHVWSLFVLSVINQITFSDRPLYVVFLVCAIRTYVESCITEFRPAEFLPATTLCSTCPLSELRPGRSGVRVSAKARDFFLSISPRLALWYPPILIFNHIINSGVVVKALRY